jgi:hypothetical protein
VGPSQSTHNSVLTKILISNSLEKDLMDNSIRRPISFGAFDVTVALILLSLLLANFYGNMIPASAQPKPDIQIAKTQLEEGIKALRDGDIGGSMLHLQVAEQQLASLGNSSSSGSMATPDSTVSSPGSIK